MMSKEVSAAALAAILSVAFFAPTIFGGRYPYRRDVSYFFQPQTATVVRIAQSGDVPLWNPYGYMGMPLLATWQSRVFSVFSIPFYLFGSVGGMRIFYPLIMFLAGFFALAFLRGRGYSAAASMSGAIVWMLGGWLTTKLEFFSYASAAAMSFAPAALIGAAWWIAAAALATAFLCGYPVFFLSTLLYLALAVRAGRMKSALAASMACALLCAAQILPTAELTLNSAVYKRRGVAAPAALSHAIGWRDLSGFVAPAATPSSDGGPRYHWLKTFYAGFAGAALALAGIFEALRRKKFFWPIVLAAGTAMSFAVPYDFARRTFAPLALFRYPSTMMFFAAAAVAVLAAKGAAAVKRPKAVAVLAAVAVIELFVRGMFAAQTAPADFFYRTPEAVAVVRSEAVPRRVAVAPKTLKLSVVSGRTSVDAWQGARAILKGFVTWPYGVANVYGTGEPLAPSSAEQSADEAYSRPSPDAAAEDFRRLGAGYILSATKFSVRRKHYILSAAASPPPYLYRLNKPGSIFGFTAAGRDGMTELAPSEFSENKVSFVFSELLPAGIFYHAENYYPGWRVFVDGKVYSVERTGEGLKNVRLNNGAGSIHMLYAPASFRLGILISAMAVTAAALILFRKASLMKS